MSPALIEAIPNVSEGRDAARLDRFAAAIAGGGATLLDRTADWSHHRAVFTFAADGERIQRAAAALAAAAIAEIDLTTHAGVHPRIGALDVLPFVPLGSASMDDAVAIAHAVGREIGETLAGAGLPLRGRVAPAAPAKPRSHSPRRPRRSRGAAARTGVAPDYGPRHAASDGRRHRGRRARPARGLEPRARSAGPARSRAASPAPSARRTADSPASRRSACRSSTPARCRCR